MNKLICRHSAPGLVVTLRYSGETHHCLGITGNCCCSPLELTDSEFEAAQRGEWPERILQILNSAVSCEACDRSHRLAPDGLHYNYEAGGATWGVCRKVTAAVGKE